MPKGTIKLNQDQIINLANKKGYEIRTMPVNPKNVYMLDDMLLQFYDSKQVAKEDDLKKQKAITDLIFKRHSNYISSIKTFNNFQAQVSKAINSNKITYLFYNVNSADTWNFRGALECDKTDEKMADLLLNEILESVTFTK